MCRLLYIKSKDEFEIKSYLEKFAFVAKNSKEFQGHGWGCAYLVEGNWQHYKNINPVWEDDFSKFGNTTRMIAHARSAFRDKDIFVENNMPFYDENYIFIFNGELSGVRIKEEGRIGAERIFNFIKRFDKGSIAEALQKGTEAIKKLSAYVRAMNIIIADNSRAVVYSHSNEDFDYFTMYYKIENGTAIICSEKFPDEENWIPIENNSLRYFE
ncbi:MAG: hypothetical protein V1720_02970 [bacterium]